MSDKAQINIDGTKYDTTNTVDVIVNFADKVDRAGNVLSGNGKKNLSATSGTSEGDGDNSALTKDLKFVTGDTLKAIIDPDDNKIHTIYVTTSKLAAVTATNSEKITMNNLVGAIKIADNEVEDGLKKGDVVVVTTLYKASAKDDDAYTIVKKAETIEGEVDGWKENKTVTVDGTAQKVYKEADELMLTSIPDEDNTISTFKDTGNTYIGENVVLYMLNGYVGAAVQTSESASNYSLVTEVKTGVDAGGGVFSGLELQVMDGEGVKSIIKVDKNSPDGDTSDDYNVGDIITYTVTDSNTAKVTVEAAVNTDGTAEYDDEVKTFNDVLTTTDCVVFMQTKKTGGTASAPAAEDLTAGTKLFSGAEYKVYKIRDLGEFTAAKKGMTTVTNKDGKVAVAFVNYQGTPNGVTDSTVYGIISAFNGRVKDYYSYTVQSNGEEYTLNIDSNVKSHDVGNLVWFEKANDNTYDSTEVHIIKTTGADTTAVWTKEAEATSLTYYTNATKAKGSDEYKVEGQTTTALVKDCPIIYVDTKNDKSEAEGSIGGFDKVNGYANAIIIVNADSPAKIKALFIETSNEENIDGVEVGGGSVTSPETKHTHELTWSETKAQAATCTKAGVKAYWTATCKGEGDDCDWDKDAKYDAEGDADGAGTAKVQTDDELKDGDAKGHTKGTWGVASDVDGLTDGEHYQACTVCNEVLSHHASTETDAGVYGDCTESH